MSFGFGVGDFLAVLELISDLRKKFVDAPKEFKDISDEVRNLSIVLQDAEIQSNHLSQTKTDQAIEIVKGCKRLLNELDESLDKYSELGQKPGKGPGSAISAKARRIWKRMKWEPDDVRDIRSRIVSYIATLRAVEGQAMGRKLDILVHHHDDSERLEVLQWVSTTDFVARQNDLIRLHQPGSRQWLFDSADFNSWKGAKGKTLFCPGIPGAGKTFTMAMVVDALGKPLSSDDFNKEMANVGVFYLYCSYQNKEQTAMQLLTSLLRNVLQHRSDVPDEIVKLYKAGKASGTGIADRSEAMGLLKASLSGLEYIYIFIDALDELLDEIRRPFVKDLLALQKHCSANLFLTSRPISAISRSFKNATEVEIRASEEDIKAYLTDNMGDLVPDFVLGNAKLESLVLESITAACDGMFLLAQLHLQSLKGKPTQKAVRTALAKLATGSSAYDDAYEKAIQRIKDQALDSCILAMDALRLVTCARRPLGVEELCHALGVEVREDEVRKDDVREESYEFDIENVPTIDAVVSVCAGLLAVDKESNVARLVHKSAQEYFERNQKKWFPNAHGFIAITCHTYLLAVEDSTDHSISFPFQGYANDHWGYHQRLGEEGLVKADDAGTPGQKRVVFPGGKKSMQDTLSDMGVARLAAEFGSMDTALLWACENGKRSVVELLLRATTKAQSDSEYEHFVRGPDLLVAGASNGHVNIVQLFLGMGTNPTTAASDGRTALCSAAKGGHADVVALLLEQETINPNATSGDGQTPLCLAVGGGHDDVVSLLLEQETIDVDLLSTIPIKHPFSGDANNYETHIWTPLLMAAYKGHMGCLELLLDRSNITFKDSEGRNALWLATTEGQHTVVERLMNTAHGHELVQSHLKASGKYERTVGKGLAAAKSSSPYSHLQKRRFVEIPTGLWVRVINHTSFYDASFFVDNINPFLVAVLRNDTISAGAMLADLDINKPCHPQLSFMLGSTFENLVRYSPKYCSILHIAALPRSPPEVIKFLSRSPVTQGIDVEALDSDGKTPLLVAAEFNRLENMKALHFEAGAKLDHRDYDGTYLALKWAAYHRNQDTFEFLRSRLDLGLNADNDFGHLVKYSVMNLRTASRMSR